MFWIGVPHRATFLTAATWATAPRVTAQRIVLECRDDQSDSGNPCTDLQYVCLSLRNHSLSFVFPLPIRSFPGSAQFSEQLQRCAVPYDRCDLSWKRGDSGFEALQAILSSACWRSCWDWEWSPRSGDAGIDCGWLYLVTVSLLSDMKCQKWYAIAGWMTC